MNLQKFPSEGLSAGEPSLCHTGISLYCLCHCVLHIDDGSTIRNVCQVAGSPSEWDPCFNRYCLRLAQTVTDFADASHSKSAKSTTTTVLYGIFSSENSFPCTVICNAHQYEIACRREHLCQAYGCAKTYLEHDFPRYKTHSTIRNPGFCCPVITPISVKITSQNLNILEKGMDET